MSSRTILSLTLATSLLLFPATTAFAPFGVTIGRQNNVALLMARTAPANRGRGPTIADNRPPMNEEISANELRVVTPSAKGKDEPLGIMSRAEALAKAKELGGLDLILVNPNSDPPVCKIVDYSKYRYMQEKKAKEVKKNSKASEIKEIKMSYKIDIHDYDVRKKSTEKFIKQGNRVKCTVMFRGREVQHDALGFELLEKLAGDLEKYTLREGKAKREGKNLSLILSPRPEVLKMVNEQRKNEEKAKKKKRDEEKARRGGAAVAGIAGLEGIAGANGIADALDEDMDYDDDDEDDEDDEDDLDLESTLESSLDELFGSDNMTDDLFS